jgi:hypothetical protein
MIESHVTVREPRQSVVDDRLQQMFGDALVVFENSRQYSLYTSLLCLLCPKYNMLFTYEQKIEMVDEFVRFIIAKLETDVTIKRRISHPNQLITEIKDKIHQSVNVVYYVAMVLDLNLIVLSNNNELYFSDTTYDTCKPHVLLKRDDQNLYSPVIYQQTPILTYYDHPVIPTLVEGKQGWNPPIIVTSDKVKLLDD